MLSSFNIFGGSTTSVPQVNEFAAQSIPQDQPMEDDVELMLEDLDFDEAEFDMEEDDLLDMDPETLELRSLYWSRVCNKVKRKFKQFENEARSNGAKTNKEVAQWCRKRNSPCERYISTRRSTIKTCIKKGYFR